MHVFILTILQVIQYKFYFSHVRMKCLKSHWFSTHLFSKTYDMSKSNWSPMEKKRKVRKLHFLFHSNPFDYLGNYYGTFMTGGGYLVQKSPWACAVNMGCKISLQVYQWPHIKTKCGYEWVDFSKYSKIY